LLTSAVPPVPEDGTVASPEERRRAAAEEVEMTSTFVQPRVPATAIGPRHQPSSRVRTLRRVGSPTTTVISAPIVGSDAFRAWTDWLGRRLAEAGPTSVEPHLSRFVATALRHGVAPAPAHVVADRTQPAIVRSRAFFAVASALDEIDSDPDDDGPLAA
jgi:hypothetical protein